MYVSLQAVLVYLGGLGSLQHRSYNTVAGAGFTETFQSSLQVLPQTLMLVTLLSITSETAGAMRLCRHEIHISLSPIRSSAWWG